MQIHVEDVKIQDATDIFEIIQRVFYKRKREVDLMKEHLWAFSLNKQRKILNLELISMGTKDKTLADPGDVFRVPLYKSSSYLILVHNHPSGGLSPSETDMDITNKLIKAGDILDIPVTDHIIVTDKSFFSFKTAGLMNQLRESNKYALTFVYKKKMEKKMDALKASVEREKLEFGKIKKQEGIDMGKKESKKEIARQMLAKGIDKSLISEVTGLSKQWPGRLRNELEREKS